MVEWLVLLLLVPAIVVLVIMLVGFAGCDLIWDLDHVDPSQPGPVMLSADATSDTEIVLTWMYEDPAATKFKIKRKQVSPETTESVEVESQEVSIGGSRFNWNDGARESATTYEYTVTAELTDGKTSSESGPIRGTTLLANLLSDEGGWQGWCLVQRIEAGRLSRLADGANIQLTLRASSGTDASIDRIYISQPASGGDPYDSAAQTPVAPRHVVEGTAVSLDPVPYALDKGQPLLIAVDFGSPPSGIAFTDAQLGAVAYFFLGAHAADPDRTLVSRLSQSDGQYDNRICLIEKIEVLP